MPIRTLSPELVAKIAAGEVVERPASVVKELVENSLDAGASQVTVETAGGGLGLIRVADNGGGIPSSELELAFQRHATSKIASLEDLDRISSLGFRGEALASIAAVAQVEVVTSTADETGGSYLRLDGGAVTGRGKQGHPRGTTITVRNLLRNVPARLKFLKSAGTEGNHISTVVTQYALAYPEVRFSLTAEGKTTLRTPGSGRLRDTVVEVYGLDTARVLLEVTPPEWEGEGASPQVGVSGLVGAPSLSRASRAFISFFVNRRWVNSHLLTWAVEEAYHGLLMQDRHPVAIINISLPLEEVDVNIHPAKSEVRFRDERRVFTALQRAVRRTLVEQSPVAVMQEVATPPRPRPRGVLPMWSVSPVTAPPPAMPATAPTPAAALPALRVLGQVAGCYIAAEGPDGLYLIDQHAAHERVVFEKVRAQSLRREAEVQGLLEPATIEVSAAQEHVVQSHGEELVAAGFTLEPFGERTFLVQTVPAVLRDRAWRGVLEDILGPASGEAKNDWAEELAMSIACHSAVRSGQVLSEDEMRGLVRELEMTAIPHTCPHGRPTLIQLSKARLEKEFKRG